MNKKITILLGSANPTKKESLKRALDYLQVADYNLFAFAVDSGVSAEPIGREMIIGAENRNNALKEIALRKGIEYDFLCSIEGGFERVGALPFLVSYCVTETFYERRSTGKSEGFRITETMYQYIKSGKSINKVLTRAFGDENYKAKGGFINFLSGGFLNRINMDTNAVCTSLLPIICGVERMQINKIIDDMIEEEKSRTKKNTYFQNK